jgi:ATP-binding cassette subfamily B (MDR/TAP) protein 1
MGEGVVLESGTHDELLANESGPYARLVQAQKLRENQDQETAATDDSSVTESGEPDEPTDIEKAARDEIPLGRRDTSTRSLASEILEQRQKEHIETTKKDYSLLYLFKRIGSLNPEGYKRYAIGTFFAICEQFLLLIL